MIKAIVMDMDGTLLDSNNQILPKTKQALLELQEKGVRLILASGAIRKRAADGQPSWLFTGG